jgi:hypothetical protein
MNFYISPRGKRRQNDLKGTERLTRTATLRKNLSKKIFARQYAFYSSEFSAYDF